MISEVNKQPMPYVLNDVVQKAYDKIKALIIKIFSLLKSKNKQKNLKEEFYDSYIDFARKLKAEGHNYECYSYMSICDMYYHLIERPDELMAHEKFFIGLFDSFDKLLFSKITCSEKYQEELLEFKSNLREKRRYFYTQVAIPSEHYDEDVLNEITGHLVGGIE
jgi:hypothetical protein